MKTNSKQKDRNYGLGVLLLLITIIMVGCVYLDSININQIFKKNKVVQARIFYFILALCMIELLTSFFYNLFEATKFI